MSPGSLQMAALLRRPELAIGLSALALAVYWAAGELALLRFRQACH